MHRSIRSIRYFSRLGAAVALATAGAVLLAAPAFAHVEAQGETATTGITTVTFAFAHGCSGSPTTSLKIQLPEGTTEVTADSPAGFTSSASTTTLTWTGGSIPDSTPGEFTAAMRLVGAKDAIVFLPTIQGCAVGEETWIEKTDDAEAENAAPRIVLTEAVAPGSTITTAKPAASSTETSVTKTSAELADAKTVSDSQNSNVGAIVIGVVMVIIVGGGVILYLRNRRPSSS